MVNELDKKQNYYDFLTEYVDFLEYIASAEDEKLKIILSNKLTELQKSISIQQTNEKKMENMEKKRISLQEEAGFSHMTFSDIVKNSSENIKEQLETLFSRAEAAVSKIKYLNARSMDVLKMNMQMMNMNKSTMGLGYSKNQQEIKVKRSGILETKV